MPDVNPAADKSFEDNAPKQPVAPEATKPAAEKAPVQPKEPKEPKAPKAPKTPKADTEDKSFSDDKKTVNKKIKVGDRVAYPYKEGEHGQRTSKVYAVDGETVTILAHDGQKTTIAIDRVELV